MLKVLNTFTLTTLAVSVLIYARTGHSTMAALCAAWFVIYGFGLFVIALAKAEADNPYRGEL